VSWFRRKVWVLGKRVGADAAGQPIYEYFTGREGEAGGPSRSPFRSDAYKFYSARAARQCADTHREMRDSEDWVVLPLLDNCAVTAKVANVRTVSGMKPT
jgi:hypothetical protein